MCRPVTCRICKKTTWAGCGQHVDQVRAKVPAGQWCPGHAEADKTAANPTEKRGLLQRLRGR